VFGVLLSVFGRGLPARVRWPAIVVFAIVAGNVTAFDTDVLVGALTGHFAASRSSPGCSRSQSVRPRTGSATSAGRWGSSRRSCCCRSSG
jgi:hypothetical protein